MFETDSDLDDYYEFLDTSNGVEAKLDSTMTQKENEKNMCS